MFKDIVLAITPSEVCEHAADKAFAFAQRFESNLNIVHVTGMERGWGEMEFLECSGETARITKNIEEYYCEKLKGCGNHKVTVVAGVPHNEILRIARKVDADLIIMGQHTKQYEETRSKVWGMAGSTLEQVSQRARCPVMIVTREAPYGEQRMKTFMVATDFSKQSECAVAYGGQLCRHYGGELLVFHAVGDDQLPTPDDRRTRSYRERMQEEFDYLLRGVPKVEYLCEYGHPAMEILKLARNRNADLVLMAHHSKEKDPEKAFLGSVVVQVALNSASPTMSINRYFDLRCGMMYDQQGGVTTKSDQKEPAPA
jgi:nucleotide-binding universal stress UspA family protein